MNTIKKGVCIAASAFLGLLFNASAVADTLLFPVIAVNTPNVITVVSVINDSPGAPRLRYIYRAKDTTVAGSPNIGGTCDSVTFTRNTADKDLVSFDASGTLNSGDALFGDTDVYGGSFDLGATDPKRAYLLVTHANNAGTRVNVGNLAALSGEAIVMDIATGAAWGMRGINDLSREDYEFRNYPAGGGVYSALPNLTTSKRFTFFPPTDWTTRFFVTPIGAAMDSANLASIVSLSLAPVYDRSSTAYPLPLINPTVTCTGAVDLTALLDAATAAALETSGGWATLATAGAPTIIYKLEYILDDPSLGGTNNNGYLFSGLGAR